MELHDVDESGEDILHTLVHWLHTGDFEFAAAPPLGPTLDVAFVPEEPVDFRQAGFAGRDKSGEFGPDGFFTEVSYTATRALRVRRKAQPDATPAAEPAPDAPTEPNAPEEAEEASAAPDMHAALLQISVTAGAAD